MGSLSVEEPSSLPHDLQVTVQETCLVFPSKQTDRTSMFLSNIDKVLNFNVETVHFFLPNSDFPAHLVADKIRHTLSEMLATYHFLAGRLRLSPETGRLEINCNGGGVGFVVASSELKLEDVGDLVYPNPAFAQLIAKNLDILTDHDQPLCIFQVTTFKCGGFAMGVSTNHATFDGLSFKLFLENFAAAAAGKPLPLPPCNDRRLLAARSPPRVTVPHPNLVQLKDPDAPIFHATMEHLDFNIFRLTSHDIAALKDKGKAAARISGFNVVTALIWRCKALSSCATLEGKELERVSTLLYAVDIRPRLVPPLPKSYTGNAVLTAYAMAKCGELLEGPFSRVVEMVGEGARRVTDEFARSSIDWGEINHGFPHGEVLVSSWWKLGFEEVEYPWGKPKYSCPVVYRRKDIILLFPDIDKRSNGINILVALPCEEMARFKTLYHDFLRGVN